ncbi:MAG: transposase, partial [Bacteroidales bacterium]|nr:transposase [Bacteroidales bacterium]
MEKTSKHPEWARKFKTPGTELKLINGIYYLYGVSSKYDKNLKRSKKISGEILGKITKDDGFIPSAKKELKEKSKKTYLNKSILNFEYGYSKWLFDTLKETGILENLKIHFPDLWQFIVSLVYTRSAYQSPLKNIPFHLSQSSIKTLLCWNENLNDQKISNYLYELGSQTKEIHNFIKPKNHKSKAVLIDATNISLRSSHISLSQKGYNSNMDFQKQFILLYIYDASNMTPLYYRMLVGNMREITAMKNTIEMAGLENCIHIADKGFFSETNILKLEELKMPFIIPIRRDNTLINYSDLEDIEQTDNYFNYENRFIFYADSKKSNNRSLELFLDGKLKEMEKTDYLRRIQSHPEDYTKAKFNTKVKSMGSFALLHNTDMQAEEVYNQYKIRGEIEQFFDHLKNTIDADVSNMQREQSLNAWMFINHLSMIIIYKLYETLKTTPLNKKQMLNHKYSIKDVIMHLKAISKIQFGENEYVISEQNKATKELIQKMKISI